jgi:hypothetical protein
MIGVPGGPPGGGPCKGICPSVRETSQNQRTHPIAARRRRRVVHRCRRVWCPRSLSDHRWDRSARRPQITVRRSSTHSRSVAAHWPHAWSARRRVHSRVHAAHSWRSWSGERTSIRSESLRARLTSCYLQMKSIKKGGTAG